MQAIAVGQRIEMPPFEGMRADIRPSANGDPVITLWAGMPDPQRSEVRAMRKGKLRLSILAVPPLVWILADAGDGLEFDCPWAPGLEIDPRVAGGWGRGWTEQERALVVIPSSIPRPP